METAERIEEDLMPQKNSDGRDELNLAEFPLCALAHRLRPEQKTLRFEDRVWDDGRGKMITRQLIITGSDAYGLPTALDEEVLLGLIQLTRQRDFADRKVPFTRHLLLQVLGWRGDSKSYERLEASLNRWTGVTLFYQHAWWNRAKQCWMDEKFHVLDNVWLCHRDAAAPDIGLGGSGAPASAFVWNEVIFRSFQAGNLKSLDFDFFKELRSAVAKRLYRFLDKRLFRRSRREFNLKEFAWEHVGLARGYDSANLKRKLRPGIAELERRGFLKPLAETDRFQKERSGHWRVVFERADPARTTASNAPVSPELRTLQTVLVERGVTPFTAREITRQHPAEQIKSQLEVFDWLRAHGDQKVSRNPPGFLIASIRDKYLPPRAFMDEHAKATRAQMAVERKQSVDARARQNTERRDAQERQNEKVVAEFWQSIPEEQKSQIEAEALCQASVGQRLLAGQPGKIGAAARKGIVEAYALCRLRQA